MTTPPPSRDTFLLLQSWRALAAFIVMAGHTTHEALTISQKTGAPYTYIPYPNAVGVDMFFVISGFVIVYASRHLAGHPDSWKIFLFRRILRIVPIYWFYTGLMILASFMVPQYIDTIRPELNHILKSLFFIPHLRPHGDAVRPFLALGWSLNYEMYFYVLFTFFLFLPLKRLISGLSCFLISSVLLGLFVPEDWVALKFWCDPYVLEFLCGALIAFAFLEGKTLPSQAFPVLLFLGFSVLFILFFPAQNSLFSQCLRFIVGSVFVCAAVLPRHALQIRPPRLFATLGNSSYSLYLSHSFTIGLTKLFWLRFCPQSPLWLYVLLTLIACLTIGHLSYRILERPLLVFAQNSKKFLKKS